MTEMKCRLIIDVSLINAKIIELLVEILGKEETDELLKTDCLAYMVNRMLEGSWFANKYAKDMSTGIICKEHMARILSDYMYSEENVSEGYVEVNAVDYEHYTLTYDLAAASIAGDAELTSMVKHVHATINKDTVAHVFHGINKQIWILDYIVRN